MKNKGSLGCAALLARKLFLASLVLVLAVSGFAKMYEQPRSFALKDKSQEQVELKALPKINVDALLAEDRLRGKNTQHPGPMRFAVTANVSYTLDNSGTWQTLNDGRLWRLRIQSPGAKSMNLGITRFEMAEGTKLWIYDPGHTNVEGPFTARNRTPRGSLWTPIILGDQIVVEVFVPTGVAQPVMEITKVNQGYRGFGKAGLDGSEGTCNNDEICPIGDPYRPLQIQAVAMYSINNTGGQAACTGTLLNDVPQDHKNYFLSANHCLDNGGDPASIVLYWNFESAACGTHGPGSLADNQTGGATLRANYANSDFALFELSTTPDPAYNVHYAGWDATGVAPASTGNVHHPSADVKAVSISNTAPRPADWNTQSLSATGNHWWVDWDSGVTEGGSSGSCLFGPFVDGSGTHQRCIGQLHGGPSACGSPIPGPTEHDFYGMFSVSWNGGGTSATRLKDWLDPTNTGALTNDGDPHITTANGIHYNFQGAGEYVSLRNSSGLEIQTREAPIATTFNPGADPYDGVATCVSLNTAVAARVGKHRVTYEPNLSGVPDPSGLQLRLDGILTTLGSGGQDLGDGGRITQTSVPGGLEIDFPDSNVLLVTPGWWADQAKWYMNVDVVRKAAVDGSGGEILEAAPKAEVTGPSSGGLMAAIPDGNWLSSLPDGTPMGPMPASVSQRYTDLYHKFGDAWRVTDATSLFDYAPGTSTSTFSFPTWPPQNAACTIPGVNPAQPATLDVAEQVCRPVTGTNAHADCVFDVRVTGNTGFATTYLGSQNVETGAGGTTGPPPPTPFAGKLAVFLDLGAGIPHGTFSNAFNTGFSLNAGLEYLISSHVSAEGIFGYHHFPGKIAGDVNVYQFSGNAKVYLTPLPNKLRPFVNGGIGGYKFSPGSSYFGGNFGGGLLYELTSQLGLQSSYNFHTVNTPVAATKFSTLQGGIRFVF